MDWVSRGRRWVSPSEWRDLHGRVSFAFTAAQLDECRRYFSKDGSLSDEGSVFNKQTITELERAARRAARSRAFWKVQAVLALVVTIVGCVLTNTLFRSVLPFVVGVVGLLAIGACAARMTTFARKRDEAMGKLAQHRALMAYASNWVQLSADERARWRAVRGAKVAAQAAGELAGLGFDGYLEAAPYADGNSS